MKTMDATSQKELQELYRDLILDHARSPRHFGKLEDASHHAEGINPLCGDKLKVFLKLDSGKNIVDAKFEGSGCAISVASASLLTDTIIGRTADEALEFSSAIVSTLTGSATRPDFDLGKLAALQGVKEFPARVKCATLAWHALDAAVSANNNTATTE